MGTFQLYFTLGLEHIADFKGYDHILFIITLCAVYLIKDWRKILILVTAFTVGHSLTLVLATFHLITVSSAWIEFLIPVTILLTAIGNLFQRKEKFSTSLHRFKYLMALVFGLIHGLGFSNYLKSLLNAEEKIAWPLFSFNVGIEVGQLMVVSAFLLLALVLINVAKVSRREWNLVISGAGLGISLLLIFERIPF